MYILKKNDTTKFILQTEANPINLCKVILDYGFCIKN